MLKYRHLALAFLLSVLPTLGQEFRATISGSVTDPSGAAVPDVKVTAAEVRTGTTSNTVSDATGHYTIPFLLPGNYDVTAQASGFSDFNRKGLQLGSGDHPIVDIPLRVGEQSQAVDVTADAPLVNNASASTGQTITTKQVEDLPVNGRTPLMLAQLSIGVLPESSPSLVHPFDNGGAAAISIGGSKIQSAELLLDGSPDATWDGRVAYNPPMDAVQQVTVNIFDSDAAYGHTSAGTANQITKSGTNAFHGSLYEFNQTNATSANNFFSNASGKPIPTLHYNQYGLTAGAPVIIPKLYNGKNKLFWFFAWEGLRDNNPTPIRTTVPTAAERNGDFSQLLSLGANYQIYNPYTGTQNGKVINRKPFAGNRLPTNLLNPIAQAYLNFYPQPNTTGLPNGEDNYFVNAASIDTFDNEFGRLDYNIGDNDKLFFEFRHNVREQDKNNLFNSIATGSLLNRKNFGSSLDEVHTFGATTVLDLRLNWTRMSEVHSEPSAGFDPSTLGFPGYIAQSSPHLQLPYISFGSCGSYTSFQCLGDTGAASTPSESYQIFGSVVKVLGSHTLKFGGDARQYRLSNISYGSPAGSYTFGTNWTQGPTTTSSAAPIGQEFASFLLGLPTSGSYSLNSFSSLTSYYYGIFLQDDWRVKSNLTLNLGVRFEQDLPETERYNRVVNGFDATGTNPIAVAAQAAYAANYAKNPGLYPYPPSAFNTLGGVTFANSANPDVYQTLSHKVSPRVGFSWSPAVFKDKTVFRGGFGIFVAPITVANIAANGNISSSPIINQEGFSQTTTFPTSSTYLTPLATLSNPFPTGILQPVGSSQGLATFAGQSVSFFAPRLKSPYSERWEFDIQQQLAKNLLFEIAYIGNRGNNIPIPQTELNAIPRQYLSTSNYRDPADNGVISYLGQSVPNPYYKLIPNGTYNSSSVVLSQLLAPYTQFPSVINGGALSGGINGIVMQNNNAGSSWFNSLNVRVEKRYSNGLSLIGNYMWSKLMEQDDYLNDTDTRPETRVSPFDHPHHISLGLSYNLPIGRGLALDLKNRWTNAILGGWVVNGIYQWEIGAPLYFANNLVYCSQPSSVCNGYGGPVNFNPSQTNGPALNLSAFDLRSADQPSDNIRTFSTTFGNIRQDNANNLDASLLKNFNINETTYFQLRFEGFNVMNHPVFGAPPVSSPTSATFGLISASSTPQVNSARAIQIGARFVW